LAFSHACSRKLLSSLWVIRNIFFHFCIEHHHVAYSHPRNITQAKMAPWFSLLPFRM
jgi:hypothetical protein